MNEPALKKLSDIPDHHFIRHVIALCAKHKVIAADDVMATSGVKLVAKNTRINIELYDRLVNHRLVQPLDQNILVEESVNAISLLRMARDLTETDPLLRSLVKALPNPRLPQECLAKIVLTNVATRLTVMREQLPEHFRHSVKASLVAASLGFLCLRKADDAATMASIGLLHDLGDLHLDPEIFSGDRPLSREQHQQIRTHTEIGALTLELYPEFRPHISRAVLEHHERQDGSGYPMGLKASEISVYGRIMAVVELVVGISDRPMGLSRLPPILKAQSTRLDSRITNVLLSVLRHPYENLTKFATDVPELVMQLDAIQACLNAAPPEKDGIDPDPSIALVLMQLQPIRTTLRQAGLTGLGRKPLLDLLEHSAEAFAETSALTAEAAYQMQAVLRDLERREADPDRERALIIAEQVGKWMHAARKLESHLARTARA